jgi:hypothetical protein
MPDGGIAPVPVASAPVACEHLAYEVDEAARIVTVVYIGDVDDAQVLAFYENLLRQRPDAPTYDFMVDMRYTEWAAACDVLATIDAMFRVDHPQPRLRRVAVVRKDAGLRNNSQSKLLHGLKNREVRYFKALEMAQAWLQLPDA